MHALFKARHLIVDTYGYQFVFQSYKSPFAHSIIHEFHISEINFSTWDVLTEYDLDKLRMLIYFAWGD